MVRRLFKDKKSRKQIALYCKDRNLCIDEPNAQGLARYEAMKRSGVWEHQNFIENFGEEEVA